MSVPSSTAAAKSALRTRLLRNRSARPEAERAAAAVAVGAALADGLAGAGTVAAYAPDAVEPGHGVLPGALTAVAGRVLLPVIPPTGHELGWAVLSDRFVVGRFGLLEPAGPRFPPAALADADVVVVPALAVDRSGRRLGRGGGYYDRALRHARPGAVLVAVLFDDEVLDAVPAEPHDIAMTAVVTPAGGWRPLDSSGASPH